MLGATAAGAFAANYPAPFASEGAMVVVGANADASDMTAATSIMSDLSDAIKKSTSSKFEGGDSFLIEDGSNKLNLGDSLNLAGTLNDEDMENFLASGKYKDINRKEYTYDQTILVQDRNVTFFSDSSYKDKTPAIGLNYGRGDIVLQYKIDFNGLDLNDSIGTDLPLMSNMYYVLDYSATSGLVLLDSSASSIVAEKESKDVNVNGKSYHVEVSLIDSDGNVKFVVNGEPTEKIAEKRDYELNDGAYIAVKETLVPRSNEALGSVEFTIGSGKLELPATASEIEINDERVKGVESSITDNDTITITWKTNAKTFLAEKDDEITLPGFNTIKMIYGGMVFPSAEKTTLDADDIFELQTTVKDGSLVLPLLDWDGFNPNTGNLTYLGESSDARLITSWNAGSGDTQINLTLDDYFVATYVSSNGKEFYSYAYELDSVSDKDGKIEVVLNNLVSGADNMVFADIGRDRTKGKLKIALDAANDTTNAEEVRLNLTSTEGGGAIAINKVITNKGLLVDLPELDAVGNLTLSNGVNLTFLEADKDLVAGKGGKGKSFVVTVENNSKDNRIHVSNVVGNSTMHETKTKDVYNGYVTSDLATMFQWDKSADSYDLEVNYYGEEVVAKAYVAAGSVSAVSEVGAFVTLDTDTAKISGKNLVVVGGSAINSVAAELLGGAHSGEAFTAATGVSAGQFLIQSFEREGKVALLVAGYEAEDTAKAAVYLKNNANAISTADGAKQIKSTTVVADTV
jgi:hypothetical protein